MICGIGIDLVEIDRFSHWHTYSDKKLLRILSAEEINYCKSIPALSATRFAARFAVREAAYKAFSTAFTKKSISFLKFCRAIKVQQKNGQVPQILFNWKVLEIDQILQIHCSITHSRLTAGALVAMTAIDRNEKQPIFP